MAAAHLRGPAIEAAPAAYFPGCTGKLPLTLPQARAVVIRRGRGAFYRCLVCRAVHVTSVNLPRWAALICQSETP